MAEAAFYQQDSAEITCSVQRLTPFRAGAICQKMCDNLGKSLASLCPIGYPAALPL